jgi:hypothetical protein
VFYLNAEPGLPFGECERTKGDVAGPSTCAPPAELRDSVLIRRLGVNREEGGMTVWAEAGSESRWDVGERARFRRAVEAVVWGMPAVNFDLMYQAMVRQTKGAFNQIVYWSGLPDWKNQTLTPNPDSIYLIPFIDTTDVGPVVLEIPPAEDGSWTAGRCRSRMWGRRAWTRGRAGST